MEYEYFLYEEKDGVAVFTVNRPEVRNALNTKCWEELGQFINNIGADSQVKLAIITGTGEKAFVAGADIKGFSGRTVPDILKGGAQSVLRRLAACPKPTIAALNGVAFGGGCELAMACDIRIAAEHVKIGLPELGLGIIPGGGGTQRLAKLVGLGRAKEIILTGRSVPAQEALQIGLVNKVTPAEKLMPQALEMAGRIMSKGPLAVHLAKQAIDASMSSDEDSGMMLEMLSYAVAFGTDDRKEGAAAFLEKRPPRFQGR